MLTKIIGFIFILFVILFAIFMNEMAKIHGVFNWAGGSIMVFIGVEIFLSWVGLKLLGVIE